MRSESRGQVSLLSNRPEDAPRIVFNYMSANADWRIFRHCIRLTQEIFSRPAMAEFTGKPIAPAAVSPSDEELNDFIRKEVESAFHPCGTCRWGQRATKRRSLIPIVACSVWTAYGWRIRPFFRTFPTATSTLLPSWSEKKPPLTSSATNCRRSARFAGLILQTSRSTGIKSDFQ